MAEVCKRGHPRTPENTQARVTRAGGRTRACRLCHRERQRLRDEARRRQTGSRCMAIECRNGHRRTPDNTGRTKIRGKWYRYCKICHAAARKRQRHRRVERGIAYREVGESLKVYVAMAIGRRPRAPREIVTEVRDEYGSISERQVYRALAALRDAGRIERVGIDRAGKVHRGRDDSGYVLTRRVA